MFQNLALVLFLIASVSVSSQASSRRKVLKDFPERIELSAEHRSGVTCSDSCPETVTFSLRSIDGLQLEKRLPFKDFLSAMSSDISTIYAYRISTPGVAGGESMAHPLLLRKLMDQLNCDPNSDARRNLHAHEVIFRQHPERLSFIASLTENLFRGIFVEIRSLGQYDKERSFPYYYPQFKPLDRYHGFSCYQQTHRDEDGVTAGIVYYGFMIGDEVDFSPEAQLPPVGFLGNESRLGFLVLFRKGSWE